MDNKKGEINVGTLMVVFISVIVGVILFTAVAQQVGTTTNTVTLANYTATAAANGESFYITDYKGITVSSITNGTTGTALEETTDYTVTNNVVYNGALATQVTVNADTYESETWAINGVAQPLTYISDSGSRSVASLIAIFFALMIALVALVPTLRSGVLEMVGK